MKGLQCVFGGVLFDIFPDGSRVLGCAPFNVVSHLRALAFARVGRSGATVADTAFYRPFLESWDLLK